MEYTDGFVPILAVFYAVFHPTEGTKVVHQTPQGSIVPPATNRDTSALEQPFFDFATVKNYVIPKPQLCDRLITFKIDQYRVVGYPVNIVNSDYARNSFSFNFCFVFPYDSDTTPYEPAIKRNGKMFRVLEEQSQMLSILDSSGIFFKNGSARKIRRDNDLESDSDDDLLEQTTTPGQHKIGQLKLSSIESLIQQIYQDLNNYSECRIPLDSSNSVDIKLFPILAPPTEISSSDVPISLVKLTSLVDVNWDPTMVKILPYIDGINSIKKISLLADADYALTKQCIQHLMHYKCIVILDIFQFSNIYSPTNSIGSFLEDKMADECQAYVVAPNPLNNLPANASEDDIASLGSSGRKVSHSYSSRSLNMDTRKIEKTTEARSVSHNINPMAHYVGSISPSTSPTFLKDAKKSHSNISSKISSGEQIKVPSKSTLFHLYRSLHHGQTVKEWYLEHRDQLQQIDIRRFLSFGVLRGIIYRVHSYPIMENVMDRIDMGDEAAGEKKEKKLIKIKAKADQNNLMNSAHEVKLNMRRRSDRESFKFERRKQSFNDNNTSRLSHIRAGNDHAIDSDGGSLISDYTTDEELELDPEFERNKLKDRQELSMLIRLLKEFHNYDTICTELQKPRSVVEALVDQVGDNYLVNS